MKTLYLGNYAFELIMFKKMIPNLFLYIYVCAFNLYFLTLRHSGPGVLSYCNRGPDTNGSLFQVTFRQNENLDEKHVVFGSLANDSSYEVLGIINEYGSSAGSTSSEIIISDCGVAYPFS
jgi:hypothetical protein